MLAVQVLAKAQTEEIRFLIHSLPQVVVVEVQEGRHMEVESQVDQAVDQQTDTRARQVLQVKEMREVQGIQVQTMARVEVVVQVEQV